MLDQMPADYVDANFDFFAAGSLDESVVTPDVEQLTGHPPRTFAQWTSKHAAEFDR